MSAEATTGGAAGGGGRRLTRVRLALAIGISTLALFSLVVLLERSPRRSGSNLTGDVGYVIPLGPGQQLCEPGELVPGDTGALELGASTPAGPGPALAASVSGPGGGALASGSLRGGWRTGAIRIPLSRIADSTGGTVCIANRGARAVAFAGSVPDSGFTVQIAGQTLGGRMRIEYLRPGSESWLQLLPTLAYRLSLAKSDIVRHWAAEGALLLMLLAVSLAVLTIAREERA